MAPNLSSCLELLPGIGDIAGFEQRGDLVLREGLNDRVGYRGRGDGADNVLGHEFIDGPGPQRGEVGVDEDSLAGEFGFATWGGAVWLADVLVLQPGEAISCARLMDAKSGSLVK